VATTDADIEAENARLRAQVDALEAELAALKRDTAQVVAEAQETLYWFERWGVDFNSVMSRPQADQARKAFRGARRVYRWGLNQKRRVL
jgi:hypothetical protein